MHIAKPFNCEEFIMDMKKFEKAAMCLEDKDMLAAAPIPYTWSDYIIKKHIDLDNSDYEYVARVMNVLKTIKIRWTVAVCFRTAWMTELHVMNDKNVFGGRVRLCEYMVTGM